MAALSITEEPRPKRVLVADDERHIARLVQLSLERHGFEVLVAHDGAQAMELLKSKRPDIAVLDVMMPYVDGIEVLRAIRRNPDTRDLPVVLLTVKAQDNERVEGYQNGADMYLTKPFNPIELLRFVSFLTE
jgi:two-component system alkaline phosphatase synthesis response regulator PhoP/two-component system response regulator VicR